MTKKVYRTAQGKIVDLGALMLQNEDVRAVGNMGVNARGDLLDSQNRPIESRNRQVTRQYGRQTTNVSDEPVITSRKRLVEPAEPDVLETQETMDDLPLEQPPTVDEPVTDEAPVGLAAAIAKARAIKQEPLKSPRQLAQAKPGVNKI